MGPERLGNLRGPGTCSECEAFSEGRLTCASRGSWYPHVPSPSTHSLKLTIPPWRNWGPERYRAPTSGFSSYSWGLTLGLHCAKFFYIYDLGWLSTQPCNHHWFSEQQQHTENVNALSEGHTATQWFKPGYTPPTLSCAISPVPDTPSWSSWQESSVLLQPGWIPACFLLHICLFKDSLQASLSLLSPFSLNINSSLVTGLFTFT